MERRHGDNGRNGELKDGSWVSYYPKLTLPKERQSAPAMFKICHVALIIYSGLCWNAICESSKSTFDKVPSVTETKEKKNTAKVVASYLVGCVDVGADGRPAGLQHVWRAQRRGGHGGSAL